MTCILFTQVGGTLYAAGDGRVTSDQTRLTDAHEKIIRLAPDVLIGAAGYLKDIARVLRQWKPPKPGSPAEHYAQAIADVPDDECTEWLVSRPGHAIWHVSEGAPVALTRLYGAIGSGAAYALGYWAGMDEHVYTGPLVLEDVCAAVRFAAQYDVGCGPVVSAYEVS